ncbi:tyrosine-type recombinase/integrase [Nocardioides speluncae]|uniref:tyrosine-type recombinase/integrase n=1 Tax=Nocardioides speluncae TaxID=2670337 RepID=UPI000D68F5F9|nr:site-specific integrase [Nocardioides speluncae]
MSSIKKRPNGRWRARYRDGRGKEPMKTFDRKVDAQRWLDEQTAALVTGQYVDPRAGKETFKTYAEQWRTRQIHRERTEETFESILRLHLYPTLGDVPLDRIRKADVQKLVKAWTVKAKPSTVEGRFTVLSIVLKAAVGDRRIIESPTAGVKLPPLPAKSALVPITTETVVAVRDAMPGHFRALVTVGAGTGMRRSELLGLTVDRVDFLRKTVRVDRQLAKGSGDVPTWCEPKTVASDRLIPVADVVIEALSAHLAAYPAHKTGLIFQSAIGTPLRPSTLWTAWHRAAKAVGTDATPHDLRHYYASVQIRGGQSIKVLQALLGHKSATETLDTYGHLMGDEDDRSRAVVQSALGIPAGAARAEGAQ